MKVYKIILAVIVLVIIGLGIRYIESKLNTENIVEQIQIVKKVDNELQRIMDEENFKKGTILRARKVVNDNNKKIEINRNKKALDLIESEYEAIRQEELLLSGIDGVSLK